ncbi:ribonuclease E inhibitor RraB [Shewanella acanthi]|uniref:ribonuclease E inhibitor RraB n=1 Tax=Shewanella acanthi TaxID=2864212 RepID=UPI001C65FFD0|nr:ribonuclease E inhibitor RraB [Shewanella acanthi]MCH1931621.1 ribonuclease E inhibitor RraB [Shewanella shenzhenensis]QYJ77680.1 ribonuclease E inhibitor RraB [Shewanella acanthi]
MQFPDDDNGKMLAAMAEAGIDLTQPLDVDYFLVFDDQRDAESALEELANSDLEGEVELNLNDELGKWEIIVCINMVPDYDDLVEQETVLNDFAAEFGGMTDGWGVMQHQEGDDEFMDDDHEHDEHCGCDH